jgi:hypothetical protein
MIPKNKRIWRLGYSIMEQDHNKKNLGQPLWDNNQKKVNKIAKDM